jgi:broad-specificity NMP kinase
MSHKNEQTVATRKGMFCYECGRYTVKRRELSNCLGYFTCDACGYQIKKTVLPLFIVTGASGVGKSAIVEPLQHLLIEYGVFDKDHIWATDWDMVYNNFFRIASALAQGNKKTVVVGTIIPEHLEGLSDRDLVGDIFYINLHTDDQTRRTRLTTRRKWGLPSEEFIQEHARFAAQLLMDAETNFGHPMPTIDTTSKSPKEVAKQIADWISAKALKCQSPTKKSRRTV